MTRVVLRHTGRPLVVPGSLRLAYSILFAAVPIRLAADMPGPWAAWLALMAALLWAGAFSIYFVVFARTLITPSLPRGAPLRP
jgi:uncharacterized protein involved in response to NO